ALRGPAGARPGASDQPVRPGGDRARRRRVAGARAVPAGAGAVGAVGVLRPCRYPPGRGGAWRQQRRAGRGAAVGGRLERPRKGSQQGLNLGRRPRKHGTIKATNLWRDNRSDPAPPRNPMRNPLKLACLLAAALLLGACQKDYTAYALNSSGSILKFSTK